MTERISIFIDGSNLYHALKSDSNLLRNTCDRIHELNEDLLADCWRDGKRKPFINKKKR